MENIEQDIREEDSKLQRQLVNDHRASCFGLTLCTQYYSKFDRKCPWSNYPSNLVLFRIECIARHTLALILPELSAEWFLEHQRPVKKKLDLTCVEDSSRTLTPKSILAIYVSAAFIYPWKSKSYRCNET
jgi:hypothetical protein